MIAGLFLPEVDNVQCKSVSLLVFGCDYYHISIFRVLPVYVVENTRGGLYSSSPQRTAWTGHFFSIFARLFKSSIFISSALQATNRLLLQVRLLQYTICTHRNLGQWFYGSSHHGWRELNLIPSSFPYDHGGTYLRRFFHFILVSSFRIPFDFMASTSNSPTGCRSLARDTARHAAQ